MRREEVLHIARAAARIAGATNVIIVGSQAILGTYHEDELASPALASTEADVLVLSELVFPDGWQGRLLHLVADDDGEVEIRAYFPEVHDLCAAKLGAGRPHDRAFVQALFTHRANDGSRLLDGTRLEEAADRRPTQPPGIRDRAATLVAALRRGTDIELRNPPT